MSDRSNRLIVLLASLGSFVLLNLVAADHFFRIDLTRDQNFTLSEASRQTMLDLEDQITVTAYFTSDLPPSFETQKRYTHDLLEEYRAVSKGQLSFEFVDPQAVETDEDRAKKKDTRRDIFGRRVREQTSVEAELEAIGIRPVEIRVIEDDAAQTKFAYLGIAVHYQEELEVIPVLQGVGSLEYDLTTIMRRLTRTRVPVLGVATGHGEISLEEDLQGLAELLGQNYEVIPVDLAEGAEIDSQVDALLLAGNREPYDEDSLRAIDQFLMQGKGAAVLLDVIDVSFQDSQLAPVDHGLGPLLESYGVRVGSDLVADVECASVAMNERRGMFTVQVPVRFPFIPQPRVLAADSPLTRGVSNLTLPFTAPLYIETREGVEIAPVVQSTPKSWLEPPDPRRLDPRRDWGAEDVTTTGPYNLVVRASGLLPSHLAADGELGQSTADGLLSQSLSESRLIVAGSSGFLRQEFFAQGNAALMLNAVDWLLLDSALLEMRTRGAADVPIDPDLTPTARSVVKYANVVGVPVLLGLYGLIRRVGRERRRALLSQTGGASS